ncbi:carboxymuconolactone decarboxylase family protein [Novosphingobium bradum]|uniref:Carboxymuconolactone decarboxylase family protein n=1 Tax=Novosphingobium bradum TaxID=1737444 RepID=A0ABV7ILW1_9SPHN
MAFDPDRTGIAHADRRQQGHEWYEFVMRTPPPPPATTFLANGILDFVFSEMWSRPGLDMRARRWVTLACVCAADTVQPIESHIYAALKSGDVTLDEINEFALHFAVYLGWPKTSIIQSTIGRMWAQVQAEGGPEPRDPPARQLDVGAKPLAWTPPTPA